MQIRCTACGKTLQVDDQFAGKKVKCPCAAVLLVPAGVVAASSAATPRPSPGVVRAGSGPLAAAKPGSSARPVAGGFGVDRGEISSLFDELTDNDMLVRGPTTEPKKAKKTKDPLAAYGGASIPSGSSNKPTRYAASSGKLKIASRGQRLATFLLDYVAIIIGNVAFGLVIGIALVASGNFTKETITTVYLYIQIASWVLTLSYFVVLEATTGRTIGKLVAGTRVVSADGSDASFGQALGRTACRLIPFEPFSFLMGSEAVGWHDSIPGTRVISTRS